MKMTGTRIPVPRALGVLIGILSFALADSGQFYGGSMSYTMKKVDEGRHEVRIELITGWVLGKGPCGPNCTEADIGRSTRSSRPLMLRNDPGYLGNYTYDFLNKTIRPYETQTGDMNTDFNNSYEETVIAVSTSDKWEQELLHFSFMMLNYTDEMDINFDGKNWTKLAQLQVSPVHDVAWHFQTMISSAIRSDTGRTNESPKSIAKPIYRIKLGEVTEIRIPAIDRDGDYIRCELAAYIEGGGISMLPPPNISIHENCSVFINASEANGYTDNTWIAVQVSVRDYNKENIDYGENPYLAFTYSLASTTVQFAVQVLANLSVPVFVEPTPGGNHVFIMYADTTWRTEIYAKATENTTIDSFTAFGTQKENFLLTPLMLDKKGRPRVKYSTISWKPSSGEHGRHIACVSVSDNNGVDSTEQRCFILDVQAKSFHYTTTIDVNKPYFVDIPSPDQLVACKILATCVVALYIHSTVDVAKVEITQSFVDKYELGPIQTVIHKGVTMYQVDFYFEQSRHGKEIICFRAKDIKGQESEIVCIKSHIEPPDPCVSAPCKNSGTCERDNDTGGFRCLCLPSHSGPTCAITENPCESDPCVKGNSLMCIGQNNILCWCNNGFTGPTCSENINECFSQPCLNAGICVDNVGSFTCNCSSGFDGKLCEKVVDPCLTNPCVRGNCFSHQSQFLCRCPSGFTGRLCDKSIYLSLNGPVETFLKVQHGGELLLNCSVSGVHPPKFHWTKLRACDTEVEKNKASVFHLSHVSFGSAGTYTCTASDGISRNVTSYFHVEITTTSHQELCNFDDGGLCGWTQPTNDSFDWTFQNGPTQSDGTGPNADHTKGTQTGKYLYIESSSPRSFGEYADLLSPILPANQTMCFEFWYYMFGDGTGRLFVFLQDICLKKETQLFNLTGDQGQRWNRAAVIVTDKSVPNDYRVVVRADVGQTFHGDTAIDDLTTTRGICKGTQGASIVG